MLRYLDKLDPTKTDFTPAQLLLIPIMGALFLLFLPVIGFYLLGEMIVQRTIEAFSAPVPVPGAAYLTGREATEKGDPLDAKLDALEKEIASKR